MAKISKFVQMWNDGTKLTEVSDEFARWVGDECAESFKKQYSPSKTRPLGLSQVGKPAVLLAAAQLGMKPKEHNTLKMQWIFNLGDFFETTCFALMAHYRYEITECQKEIDFYGAKGHIDGVVDGRLVELKTMSGYYWQKFIKEQDDDRGYLTQLHLYAHCMGVQEASWLCLNKFTGELIEVQLDFDPYYVRRAKYVLETLPSVRTFEDIKKYFAVPEPVINKQNILSLPESMRWCGLNDYFYVMKGQRVVSTKW